MKTTRYSFFQPKADPPMAEKSRRPYRVIACAVTIWSFLFLDIAQGNYLRPLAMEERKPAVDAGVRKILTDIETGRLPLEKGIDMVVPKYENSDIPSVLARVKTFIDGLAMLAKPLSNDMISQIKQAPHRSVFCIKLPISLELLTKLINFRKELNFEVMSAADGTKYLLITRGTFESIPHTRLIRFSIKSGHSHPKDTIADGKWFSAGDYYVAEYGRFGRDYPIRSGDFLIFLTRGKIHLAMYLDFKVIEWTDPEKAEVLRKFAENEMIKYGFLMEDGGGDTAELHYMGKKAHGMLSRWGILERAALHGIKGGFVPGPEPVLQIRPNLSLESI